MLETEISSHDAIVHKLLQQLGRVSDESYFKEEIVASGNALKLGWQSLKEMSEARSRKIRESVFFHKVSNRYVPSKIFNANKNKIVIPANVSFDSFEHRTC